MGDEKSQKRRKKGSRGYRNLHRFVNGIGYLLREKDDESWSSREFDIVMKTGKVELRYYKPSFDYIECDIGLHGLNETEIKPVLLIPPLMVRPVVYDLKPGHSLVEFLCERGIPVYVLDLGAPDGDDAQVSLDDYITEYLSSAIDKIKEMYPSRGYFMMGYCMGGIFSLMQAAYKKDKDLAGIITIGTPINSRKMGMLSVLARFTYKQIPFISKSIGNVPGTLSSSVFKIMTPLKTVTRSADLIANMWNEEYIETHVAFNRWLDNFVDYPQAAFEQFSREFMAKNKLFFDEFVIAGKKLELGRIPVPIMSFAGKTDKIVPIKAARALYDKISHDDKVFKVVSGGHIGVMAGTSARAQVWQPAFEFMTQVSADGFIKDPNEKESDKSQKEDELIANS